MNFKGTATIEHTKLVMSAYVFISNIAITAADNTTSITLVIGCGDVVGEDSKAGGAGEEMDMLRCEYCS